jgi:hypothetical protein
MKKKRTTVTKPEPPIGKFKPGQRVVISPTGITWLIAKPGTTGTVIACGLGVEVVIDGQSKSEFYIAEDWELVEP